MRFRNLSPKAVAYRQRQAGLLNKACGGNREPKLEYLLEYKGRKVVVTDHVKQRSQERHGMPVSEMKTYFKHMIDGIDQTEFKPVEYNQEVFVYVRAFLRGCIVAFRRDFKDHSNKDLILAIVTMYPYGRSIPSHPDTQIIYV